MAKKWKFIGIGVFVWGIPSIALALPPENLFDGFWSSQCAEAVQIETTDYTSFTPTEWCQNSVDDFRVQSHCEKVSYKALPINRVKIITEEGTEYIAEFLWASQISIMEIVKENPLELKQIDLLGRAVFRENLETKHLYCP